MTGRALALAGLSGLLLAASFPSVGLTFLAWIALLPLFASLKGQSPRPALWLAGVFAFVFFCSIVPWVAYALHVHGRTPLLPAIVITLLFCGLLSLFIAPFGAFVVLARKRHPSLFIIAAPAAWISLELARTHLLTGFPWALAGYSQYRMLPLIQIADVTGVTGVSFLVVMVNAALFAVIEERKRIVPLLVSAAVIGAVSTYGIYRLGRPDGTDALRIAVIQGNIEQDKKWDPVYQAQAIATYGRLTGQALAESPDIVLWPETATPFYFEGSDREDAELTESLRQFVRTIGTPLLTGSPFYEQRSDRTFVLKNSAYLLGRDGRTASVYHKIHLVPFGEYVPYREVLPFVQRLVQAKADFQGGSDHTVMQVLTASGHTVPVGTVICYEIIFPDLVRQFVLAGARVMTTLTNDAWFGRTAAPSQHFSIAVFRAVENRVPVARAANTGISGFIDAKGRILQTSDVFTEAFLTRDLAPATGPKTFYTRFGDVFSWLCVIGAIASILPRPRQV